MLAASNNAGIPMLTKNWTHKRFPSVPRISTGNELMLVDSSQLA